MPRVDEGHLVDVFTEVRENFRNHFAALPTGRELERAFHQPAHLIGKKTSEAVEALEGFAVHFFEGGLVVPCVDVTGATIDEYPDDRLGFAREMRLLGSQGVGGSE